MVALSATEETDVNDRLRALKKRHVVEMAKLGKLVTYASGQRETLPGFFEQQEVCLDLKAQMREIVHGRRS